MNISLSAFAPENLASRDGFGSPVLRQPALLIYIHINISASTLIQQGLIVLQLAKRNTFTFYNDFTGTFHYVYIATSSSHYYRINNHAGTPKHNNYKRHDKLEYSSTCYIGFKIGWVSMKEDCIKKSTAGQENGQRYPYVRTV